MKILFLGTCAADYNPRLHTDLANCFDLNARRSNAVLLNGHTLIDCGDWILKELEIAGVPAAAIENVMVSHSHKDHFRPDHLCTLAQQAGHPIHIYASADTLGLLAQKVQGVPGGDLLVPHLMQSRPAPVTVQVGELTVTPYPSNHQTDIPGEETLHYLILQDGRKLFYGTDGAWLPTVTGKSLFEAQLNCYLFDATCGDYDDDYRIFEHNTLPMIRTMIKVLRDHNAFAPDAKLYLTHIAPSLHKPHAETVEIAARDGLLVAYDGLEVEI